MKKVLLIATVQSHICQFHKPLVEVLKKHGCEVHVAAKNNLREKNGLQLDFVDAIYDINFSRNPFSFKNIKAIKKLKNLINGNFYDYIHCNTPVGGLLGRLCARKTRDKGTTVIYTAHGFHFYKHAPIKNWILYYPIEKCLAKATDKLITICDEDYKLAKAKFSSNIYRIHGTGVNPDRFYPVSDKEKENIRLQLGLPIKKTIILIVGELNKNKNQITAIKALKEISNKDDYLLLLAGNGPKADALKKYVSKNKLNNFVLFLGYRPNIELYTKSSDVVVSCSLREGLGLNIIEGMLCKKKIYASINRGHCELLENKNLFKGKDYLKLFNLISTNNYPEECIEKHFEKAKSYTFESVKNELENIYFN